MLPKIDKPTFNITLPSNNKTIRLKMMTRREEKILLIAKEGEHSDQLEAVRQVLINCVVDNDLNVDSLKTYDAEYAFLMLRAASIGSLEKITYVDHEDEKEYEVEVDLTKVVVENGEHTAQVIEAPGMKIEVDYPTIKVWGDQEIVQAKTIEDVTDALFKHCVKKVWVGQTVHDFVNATPDEIKEFIEGIDLKTWEKIREFISKLPHLSYHVSWTNSKGVERKVELRELRDFFSF